MKKTVAAWKQPAVTGFLSLCRKDKNNTKMDDEDMDRPIYRPSGIIPTVIRPQESHGLCVIPQPERKKDRCKQSDQPNGVSHTLMDQNSTQKPVPEMRQRQTTYHKIQEMVPL